MPSSKLGKASITIRCTSQEHNQIKTKADLLGMSISEYVRFTALHANIKIELANN